MKRLKRLVLATVTLLFLVPVGLGQEHVVRVALYNIKFLSTAVTGQGDRRGKLQEVIDRLEADVIGLQEIKDRAALNLIFPSSQWEIVIDDDSGSDQDVAVVVSVIGLPSNLDADDQLIKPIHSL